MSVSNNKIWSRKWNGLGKKREGKKPVLGVVPVDIQSPSDEAIMNLFKLEDILLNMGFPGGAYGKEPTCQCRRHERQPDPWVGKIPWRRAWQPTPLFLPGESHGQKSLGHSP